MRKNKLLTVYAVLVFAFLVIPLVIITITAFGGGSAITFPIESFSFKWFANVFALKSFRRSFFTSLEVALLATLIALLVGVGGLTAVSIVSAVVFWIVAVFVLRRMAKADPIMSRVWLRHIKQQEFYPAKASRWRAVGGFTC